MLTMFESLLFIEGLQWYALSVICLLLTFGCIECRYPIRGTIGFIASIAVLQLTPLHPCQLIMNNPLKALGYVGIYFAIGIVYVFVRWIWYAFSISRKVNKVKHSLFERFKTNSAKIDRIGYFTVPIEQGTMDTLSFNGKLEFYNALSHDIYDMCDRKTLPLQVSEHISELYIWWAVWPLCIVWSVLTLLNLRKLWNMILDIIHRPLQVISDRFFKLT